MCSPATCETCGKVTWTGCGQHVDAVMADVPRDQQCTCR
ncbi:lipoate-protein ligase B [Cellulomonas iranensis]|uniref:Lipoate-protein ligase B n=1 Tax=Cellulomonas iranensis TaxID=76862 RepID=A0ABU0GI55_9CELL|nr:lipoate-protein ligase B [Cellulomonas iranensis]